VFNNLPGAVFLLGGDVLHEQDPGNTSRFNNAGTLRKAGAGTTNWDVSLTDTGTVEVQAGTLRLNGGGSYQGAVTVSAGATLHLAGGTSVFASGSAVTGAGTVLFGGGAARVAGTYAVGATSVTAGAQVDLFGDATSDSFTNAGAVTVDLGASLAVSGAYTQTAGLTTLLASTLSAGGGVDLRGGLLEGSGTVQADVVNAGQINPGGRGSMGLLVIGGNYTQTATGVLNIELGGLAPGVQYDQLAVTGRATLGGALNVTLLDGFRPSKGKAFQVLPFAGHTGTFATVNLPDLGALRLDPQDDDDSLTLVTAMMPV